MHYVLPLDQGTNSGRVNPFDDTGAVRAVARRIQFFSSGQTAGQ